MYRNDQSVYYKPTKAAVHLIEQLFQQVQDALLVNQLRSDHLNKQNRVQAAAMSSTGGESYLSVEAAKNDDDFLALSTNLDLIPGKIIATKPSTESAGWANDCAIPTSAPSLNSDKLSVGNLVTVTTVNPIDNLPSSVSITPRLISDSLKGDLNSESFDLASQKTAEVINHIHGPWCVDLTYQLTIYQLSILSIINYQLSISIVIDSPPRASNTSSDLAYQKIAKAINPIDHPPFTSHTGTDLTDKKTAEAIHFIDNPLALVLLVANGRVGKLPPPASTWMTMSTLTCLNNHRSSNLLPVPAVLLHLCVQIRYNVTHLLFVLQDP